MSTRRVKDETQAARGAPPAEPTIAVVATATPLTKDERAATLRRLQATYGADVQVKYVVDADVIGGIILQQGDRVIDGSISRKKGPTKVTVTSAVPLTADENATLLQRLQAKHGEDIEVTYAVDPSIIGGVILQVGDHVIDSSIARKLEELRNYFGSG